MIPSPPEASQRPAVDEDAMQTKDIHYRPAAILCGIHCHIDFLQSIAVYLPNGSFCPSEFDGQ
eukprot:5153305-Amphidinium_carterae.1